MKNIFSLSNTKDLQDIYKDRPIRIILSLIAAHIMVLYNDTDGFFYAAITVSYLRGLVASFIIAYLMTVFIHWITVRLDASFDWHSRMMPRFMMQLCLGALFPALLTFFLVAAFLGIYDINIFETEYLRQDYPLVLLMILTLNLYYFGLYSYIKAQKIILSPSTALGSDENNTALAFRTEEKSGPARTSSPYKEVIMIDTLTQTIPVAVHEIAYCFRLAGTVHLRLRHMKDINESYPLNYTLKELESLLDPQQFFRINRQMLVNYSCCAAYQPDRNKTLSLSLDPPPYTQKISVPGEHSRLQIVSEDRAPHFKKWMDR